MRGIRATKAFFSIVKIKSILPNGLVSTSEQLSLRTQQRFSVFGKLKSVVVFLKIKVNFAFVVVVVVVQLLSSKIVHFDDESMKLCQITTIPKTNIF